MIDRWSLGRAAFGVTAATLLAACGGSQPPIGPPGRVQQDQHIGGARYKVLYAFKSGDDGGFPVGDLIDVNGTLYGATQFGGVDGTGTLFAYDLSTKKERVIADSLGYPYGGGPLLLLNRVLYGTGRNGGSHYEGNIFAVDLDTGKKESMCEFNSKNGRYPNMGLIAFDGKLYGTTSEGGKWSNGAIFTCDPGSKEATLIISLRARVTGTVPLAGLTLVHGTLYGATSSGGPSYYGTIFDIETGNRLHTLYNFDWSSGAWPMARLAKINGALYGTTFAGGAYDSGPDVTGTVFKISEVGKERVLYSFKDSPDGAGPMADVTYMNGRIYGTTEYGGLKSRTCRSCGTIFQITAQGSETVLHRFRGGKDGAAPVSSLLDVKGTLYGTTTAAGDASCACGTIFEITP